MRYLYAILAFFLLAFSPAASAQCDIQLQTIVNHLSCFGSNSGSIDLTVSNGTPPYTYEWSNTSATEDIGNLPAGTYTCTVTDAVACTATTIVVVMQPTQLTATASGGILTCMTTTVPITVTVSGGVAPYAFSWFNGSTNNSIIALQPGAYTVTVVDANGCFTTAVGIVNVDANAPIACCTPPSVLTCANQTQVISAACSSQGGNYIYLWSTVNGHIVSGGTTLDPVIDAAGDYTVMVTNTANGCTGVATTSVAENFQPPVANAGPDLTILCGGGVVTLVGSGQPGSFFNWSGPGIIAGANTANPVVNVPGTYTVTVTNPQNGCTATDAMTVIVGSGLCSEIQGHVRLDSLENCQTDAGEPGLSGWIVQATGTLGATYYGLTDSNGVYTITVETGDTYTLSAVPLSFLWVPCPAIPSVAAPDASQTYQAADLLFQKETGCPLLSVHMSSGNLRRCFANNFFSVWYCNNGTEAAENAYVNVTLDPLLSIVSANIPYTDQGNGVLRFDVGDLAVGECGSFHYLALLSCDAVVGQTHCTEAHIYPDSSCEHPNVQWSGASLRVTSECQTDSVHFRIENVGIGNMPAALDYIVIEDQIMLMTAPLQLNAGESATVTVPANGSTWRLEMEQEPYHPGHSSPAVSVEGCTTGTTFSTGFVAQFPTDDADEFVDILCVENTASFDPNDKQAFPKGYGVQHYIRPGTPLEYQIRFQNTGNDTAFTVRVVDTLSTWLDPATIRPGASSHPYTWNLKAAGVLSFQFDNILLPDSTTNEPASHGFIQFSILPKADAPLETVIENTADIYFDFNAAIVTNTTFHQLGENFVTVGTWRPFQPAYAVSVTPNPLSSDAWLEVKGLNQTTGLHLQVFDLQGKPVLEMQGEGTRFYLKKEHLPAGIFLFKVDQAGITVGSGKLVVQR